MGDTPQLLGDRIRTRREEIGKMPVDLARAAGVSISAVLQWESNKTKNLKLEYFFAICDLLKVNYRWLGIGQGDKTTGQQQHTASSAVFRRSIKREGQKRPKRRRGAA